MDLAHQRTAKETSSCVSQDKNAARDSFLFGYRQRINHVPSRVSAATLYWVYGASGKMRNCGCKAIFYRFRVLFEPTYIWTHGVVDGRAVHYKVRHGSIL